MCGLALTSWALFGALLAMLLMLLLLMMLQQMPMPMLMLIILIWYAQKQRVLDRNCHQ